MKHFKSIKDMCEYVLMMYLKARFSIDDLTLPDGVMKNE